MSYNTVIEEKDNLFNPFSPMFLKTELEEKERLDLLECVEDARINQKVESSGIIVGQNANEAQKNSITAGEMEVIVGDWQFENHDNIIRKVVNRYITKFALKYKNHTDTYWSFKDAYGESGQGRITEERCRTPEISDCWYVIMRDGDFHMLHSHDVEHCMISGAIYLEIPDFKFPQGMMNWVVTGNKKFSNEVFRLCPKNGDVMIWPSWILHTVYPFRGNGERKMISFNGYF